jgi:hypothetical protein
MPLVPLRISMRSLLSSGMAGFGADGQAFAAVVEAVVQREAANAQEVPIAG